MAEQNYFDQIPVWGNSSGHNFKVMADEFSGRISVIELGLVEREGSGPSTRYKVMKA